METPQSDKKPKLLDKKLFTTLYGFVTCPDCNETIYNYSYLKYFEGESINSAKEPPIESIRISFCGCGNVFIREFPHKEL